MTLSGMGGPSAKDFAALIPAAGYGTRLGLGPKAFLEIGGASLLRRVCTALSRHVDRIIVGAPPDCLDRARREVGERAEICPGGETRQETVKLLLDRATEDFILIQDVARPFASPRLTRRVMEAARKHTVVVAAGQSSVPVCGAADGYIEKIIVADSAVLPQSPQAYSRRVLDRVLRRAAKKNVNAQSIWELVVESGEAVKIVPGEETNIKITTPLDWKMATDVIDGFLRTETDTGENTL